MKVAAMYRVSTDKQVKRDGEDAIPVQRAVVRDFIATQPGWALVKEYAEEGVSGFKVSADDRDVLQQAFKDAKAGAWQALVVFKADRLSRNAFEYPIVIDRFRRIGVAIWSVKDGAGGKLLALDTQMDKFVRFLEGWQAETESKNTSIRVSEAMMQLARQGKWSGGPPPYGFKINPIRRKGSADLALIIDAEQAEIVNRMVSLYLEDRKGCKLIAAELNGRGIANPTGRPWDDQKIRRILQNPIIAGLPAYGRNKPSGKHFTKQNPYDLGQFILPRDAAGNLKPVPEYQIVPLDRWLKLLAAMKAAKAPARTGGVPHTVNARLRATDALLTGIVYCGHCGARLSADSATFKSRHKDGTHSVGRRVYYICQTQQHQGRQFCDGQRTYGCKRLERVVSHQLESLLTMMDGQELADRLLAGVDHGRQEVAEQIRMIDSEIRKTERVVNGWLSRMDAFLTNPEASPFSEEMITAKIREARERLERLKTNLQRFTGERQAPPATPEQVAELAWVAPHWWGCFQAASAEEKKVMLRDLVERIKVGRNEVEIVFRVDLTSFLPKARQMVATHFGALTSVGSESQTERPSSPGRWHLCSAPIRT